jgi:hypothetical protein
MHDLSERGRTLNVENINEYINKDLKKYKTTVTPKINILLKYSVVPVIFQQRFNYYDLCNYFHNIDIT